MSQTVYNINMSEGIAGDLIDARDVVVESHMADGDIAFGIAVAIGASATEVKTPDATSDVLRGVSGLKHKEHGYPYSAGDAKYAVKDLVNVVRRGKIRMVAAGACTVDTPVYAQYTSGKVLSSSGSNAILLPSAVFRTAATTDGDIVEVEINMPA